jgi:hypothetical protein
MFQFDQLTNNKLSDYQAAILEWACKSAAGEIDERALAINAVAGAGKSFILITLAKLISQIDPKATALFLAFNKEIVKALQGKLDGTGMTAQTINSLGHQSVAKELGGWLKVEDGKYPDIVNLLSRDLPEPPRDLDGDPIFDMSEYCRNAVQLARMGRLKLVDFRDTVALDALCAEYDIDVLDENFFAFVKDVVNEGDDRADRQKLIDFADQVYLPCRWNLSTPRYDWILIDEVQDLNKAQRTLVAKAMKDGGRIIAVGDRCQPTGTKVLVPITKGDRWHPGQAKEVNIEDLSVGDLVYSYSQSDCHVYASSHVTGITKREYTGELITAETVLGRKSKYTPNHHCLASFSPLRYHHCVYVMRKNGQYRVGMSAASPSQTVQGSGPVMRLTHEGGDALWILKFCETREEAFLWEEKVSGRFGLPQLTFVGQTQDRTDAICDVWGYIGDNRQRGIDCLHEFGRDENYPLFTDNTTTQRSLKRPRVVHACNLMTGCLMAPFEHDGHKKHNLAYTDWTPVVINREAYTGSVYSLTVENQHTYIADGIVTHNCQAIYGFAGADADSFQQFVAHLKAVEKPLSVTYRCPVAHVKLAQQYVPVIQAAPGAKEGTVTIAQEEALYDLVKNGDLILCRKTAPLIEACIKLIRSGIPARVRGRDVSATLVSLAKKISKRYRTKTPEAFLDAVDTYREQEMIVISRQKDPEAKLLALSDRCDALIALQQGFNSPSVEALCASIEGLFADDGSNPPVWLSTIHRAKGLEADRVLLLEYDHLPMTYKGISPDQAEQERNLVYVALTRSKDELVLFYEKPPIVDAVQAQVALPASEPVETLAMGITGLASDLPAILEREFAMFDLIDRLEQALDAAF